MKKSVYLNQYKTLDELEALVINDWNQIPMETVRRTILHTKTMVQRIREANGNWIFNK